MAAGTDIPSRPWHVLLNGPGSGRFFSLVNSVGTLARILAHRSRFLRLLPPPKAGEGMGGCRKKKIALRPLLWRTSPAHHLITCRYRDEEEGRKEAKIRGRMVVEFPPRFKKAAAARRSVQHVKFIAHILFFTPQLRRAGKYWLKCQFVSCCLLRTYKEEGERT